MKSRDALARWMAQQKSQTRICPQRPMTLYITKKRRQHDKHHLVWLYSMTKCYLYCQLQTFNTIFVRLIAKQTWKCRRAAKTIVLKQNFLMIFRTSKTENRVHELCCCCHQKHPFQHTCFDALLSLTLTFKVSEKELCSSPLFSKTQK